MSFDGWESDGVIEPAPVGEAEPSVFHRRGGAAKALPPPEDAEEPAERKTRARKRKGAAKADDSAENGTGVEAQGDTGSAEITELPRDILKATAPPRKAGKAAKAEPAAGVPSVSEQTEQMDARDLRRARRKARRLGFDPKTDEEAVALLIERGIDPAAPMDDATLFSVPATLDANDGTLPVEAKRQAPPSTAFDLDEQLSQIEEIQRDLVFRRRHRFLLLALRLIFFVFLPTALVGIYYFVYATEMYETESSIVVQTNDGGASAVAGLLGGTTFATAQDSIVVQDYLTSKEAMLRLDAEEGFIDHFKNPEIDPIQRLDPDASIESAFSIYRRQVTVGYDITEGVIRISVVAATPEASLAFANAIVGYAEERVDQLSAKIREDTVAEARILVQDAEDAITDASSVVAELQREQGLMSAESEMGMFQALIQNIMAEREEKRFQLAQIRRNSRPNQIQVDVLETEIELMTSQIAELRQEMTVLDDDGRVLTDLAAELEQAETTLMTRHQLFAEALSNLESARAEAARQVRYLSVAVRPIAPDVATYPRAFEYTAFAFLIFLAIYVLMSLTIAILREQMSYGN